MSRRSVVVWTAHFAPHTGGVERYTLSLWRVLAARGWQVTVVTADTGGAPATEVMDGVRVIRLPAWQLLDRRVPLPRPSRRLFDLWRRLTDSPPDLIVINTRFFPTSLLAAVLAKRIGRPLVLVEHGTAAVQTGRPLTDRLIRLYDHTLGRWVVGAADLQLGASSPVCDFLRSLGARDPKVLSNGISVEEWQTAHADPRGALGLAPDATLVAYVGRLIEEKGILDLLAAFDGLGREADGQAAAAQGADVHLVVAGVGPLAATVARRAESDPHVHFLGELTRDDVRDLLLAADILANPSFYPEALPTVLLEAAAAGAAIVATPMGGTSAVVEPNVTGVVVPPRQAGPLRDAIAALVRDPERRRRLAAAARHRVETRFAWPSIADELERLLNELPMPPGAPGHQGG